MKSLIKYLIVVWTLLTANIFPQWTEDSWSFGFGGTYPRLISIWSEAYSGTENYGAFLSLQRSFSENVALRLLFNYNYMEAFYDFPSGEIKESVTLGAASLDMLYYLVPCEPISPYLGLGFGAIYFRPRNTFEKALEKITLEYQLNMIVGVEWQIGNDWKLITDLSYHTPSTNKLDGENDTHEHKGILGSDCDTYMTFNFGFSYYFSKGEPSQKCDLPSGVTVTAPQTNQLTASDIERIIKENIPKETIKEVLAEKPSTAQEKKWILVGVNFDFNSANLTKESFPILLNALQILVDNPAMKVEVIGYTDDLGSDSYNLSLSKRRAQVVKDYMTANGISSERLDVKGMGEADPVGDNQTSEGRILNRRIEFKVKK